MNKLTKKEIVAKSNEELVAGLLWNQVRYTHEVNSRRGLTNATHKEYHWFIEEMSKRFELNAEEIFERMAK
ncbi:hypothetical protein COK15_28095 [Bacillus cereus]|uniref:hypothetical protein n=1 Tax=Bacillus cereus TaxID=1396 RepID=UPI000BF73E0C|nr:hypothetical protein [Bacillus cereus]PFQ72402.1 hypothetical protein COK15_28095 [Bacillus cereus]